MHRIECKKEHYWNVNKQKYNALSHSCADVYHQRLEELTPNDDWMEVDPNDDTI
jgi:hypothetical protein